MTELARPVMEIVDSIRNLCSEVHEAGKAEGRRELRRELELKRKKRGVIRANE